ncbi:MAG: cytochrome c oxidase assembly protein [Chloroflexota bacterium]
MLPPVVLAMPSFHAGEPDPTGWLWSDWRLDPGVVVVLFLAAVAYVIACGPRNRAPDGSQLRPVTAGQRASFFGGLLSILVAMGPPLHDWAEHYLLTAHMVQHMILLLLTPPLLLHGIPGWMYAPLVRNPVSNRMMYWLTRPMVAYLLAAAVLAAWHVPALYEAALYSDPIHSFEHLTFVATSLLAWWPVMGSVPEWPRISPLMQCLYFFALTLPGSAVGVYLTFSEAGLYRPYDTAPRVFGIPNYMDQQIAGLLMWVGEATIFLLLITYTFLRWFNEQEKSERAPRQQADAAPLP